MRKMCLNMVHRLAREDKRILFIGSDLGVGVLSEFQAEMPERFFMEGVCEAGVVGMAAGLALEGYVPYVNTIATFLTRRAYEQIILDLCLHKARVRLIGNGGGMVYAPLGPTHMVTEDLSCLRPLPNMHILCPADAREMERIMPATVELPGPAYIRLGKGYDPIVTPESKQGEGGTLEVGKAVDMGQGKDVLLICTGVMLQVCLAARDILAGQGVDAGVLHLPWIKPLDTGAILDSLAGKRAVAPKAVVTVEEHAVSGGLGSAVAELIAEAGMDTPPRFKRLGLPDLFPDRYGSQAALLERFGLDPASVARSLQTLLR